MTEQRQQHQAEQTMVRDLTQGSVWKKLLLFALPFMLANTLQTAYTMVDAVIVGQFVGAESLAAVTTCGQLMDFYLLVGMGFASAGQIMIGQFVGKRDFSAVSHTIGTLFTFLFGLGVVLTVLCIGLLDWQMDILNVPTESLAAGRIYTLVCACGIVFIYGYNCVSSILRGMGDSKRPLIFVGIASVLNVVLDLLFVIGFQMGAMGAALATVLGQALAFLVSIVYLYHRRVAFGFDFKPASFLPHKATFEMLMRLGGPMALQFAAITLSMLVVNAQINVYGVAAAAVTGIGAKMDGILRIVSNSMGTAGSAMVAQCMGAGKRERVPQVVRCILVVCTLEAVICSLVIYQFPTQVFSLFNRDAEVLELCVLFRGAAVIGYMSFGFRAAYNAVVNGIGFASLGLFSGLMDGVVARIGLAMLLGVTFGFGIQGYWYGSALAGSVSALIVGIYYYSGKWKKRKLITQR